MNLVWSSVGGATVTLGDDAAKSTIVVESLAQPELVQKMLFFRGVSPQLVPRGGDEGSFVVVIQPALVNEDTASLYLKQELARRGQSGSLAWGRVATVFTFSGAVLKNVALAELNGARLRLRYTFGFATMT